MDNEFHLFSLILLSACLLRELCTFGFTPICVSRGVIRLITPQNAADLLSYMGPFMMWMPLFFLSRASCLLSTLRALQFSMLSWLFFISPVRLTKRLHEALGGDKGTFLLDPSGHVFLVGSMLVPLWVYLHEEGSRRAAPMAHFFLRCLVSPLLLYVSFCTAAFFHTSLDIICAWILIWGLFTACKRYLPPLSKATPILNHHHQQQVQHLNFAPPSLPFPTRGISVAAGCTWWVLRMTFHHTILSLSKELSVRSNLYAFHDSVVLLVCLFLPPFHDSATSAAALVAPGMIVNDK